jgi:phosphate transport system permease protein
MIVKETTRKYRAFKDVTRNSLAYILSSFGVLILGLILVFVFSKGYKMLTPGFLFGDYNVETTTLTYDKEVTSGAYTDPNIDGVYFCSNWGIGLEDSTDNNQEKIVVINYMDNASPFNDMKNSADNTTFQVTLGSSLDNVLLINGDSLELASAKGGAEKMAQIFNKCSKLKSLTISTTGGGIRGSLISTLIMVGMTLVFALPLGIGAAVYLSLIAKNEKIKKVLMSLIDLAGGIPTIIYGLAGAIIFVPILNSMGLTNGGSLLSGALTMAILLLPIIIKTTIEAIKTVPASYRSASLALGASDTQTIFKVMVPNALPGILTAVLLAIGRIIGESAALIYAVGSAIKDKVILTQSSATLAIHIWSLCAGENPNYDASCGVAIIILLIDLILNLLVKLISYRFVKKFKR